MRNINTVKGVKKYFSLLVKKYNLAFHPDDDFNSYINHTTKKPLFTDTEAVRHNELMSKCFVICNEHNTDIYELSLVVQRQSIL